MTVETPGGDSKSATPRSDGPGVEPAQHHSGVSSARLASDEDRARAESALRDNYAHGRLTLSELTTRIANVQDGRTIGELRNALRDLPGDPWAVALEVPAAENQARTALLVALISVVVPVPPLVLGLTAAGLGARSLRAGVVVRRGQAAAAVAIGSAVALVQVIVLLLWLAGGL